jgi:septation ring formation regulator EzrA
VFPGIKNLLKNTEQKSEENNTDNITYSRLMTTDRQTLETTVLSCSDFLKSFAEYLNILLHHSFSARQELRFYKELKSTFKTGKTAVIYDFSEDYSTVQDDGQGLIGTMLRQLFIHLWFIMHKIK